MVAQPAIADVIKDIQSDVKNLVRGEIELAKAVLVPQAKSTGIGAGLFGAAGYLAISAASLIWIALALTIAGLLMNVVAPVWAYTLGFALMALLMLILAGILALVGKSKISLSSPERTIAQGQESIEAVKAAVSSGQARVQSHSSGTSARPLT